MSDRSPDTVAFSGLATGIYDTTTGANYNRRPNTGYQDADFFLGAANEYTQRLNAPFGRSRLQEFDLYIQDNWRVSRSLTLNLGFRLETYGPVTEVNKLTTTLNFNCRDSLGAAGSGPLGCFNVGDKAIGTNYYYQPRIGFAYNPGGGFYEANVNVEARYMLNENWAVLGRATYGRLLGDAADSPLVQDKNQPEISVGIVRHLNFKF